MSRRVSLAAILGFALFIGFATPASADPVSDLKAKAERIAARKEKLREDTEATAEKMNAANVELEEIGKEFGAAQVQLAEQDAGIADLQGRVFQFALNSYMLGSASSGLTTIFGEGGLGNDSAQRDGYTSVLVGGTEDITDQFRAVRQDTDRLKNFLAAKQRRQQQVNAELERHNAEIEKALAELKTLEEQNDSALSAAIVQAEAAMAARAKSQAAEAIRKQSEAFRQGKTLGPSLVAPRTPAETSPPAAVATKPAAAARTAVTAKPAAGAAVARPVAVATTVKPVATTAKKPATAGATATTVAPVATTAKAKPKPVIVVPSVSGAAGRAVAAAASQLGTPYRFATAIPGTGFDCSGLTSWAWAQAGVSIPRTSQQQWAGLPHVPLDQVQPGDLIFYYGDVHHVSIYVGNGSVIHAPFSGSFVSYSGLNGHVIGAARPG